MEKLKPKKTKIKDIVVGAYQKQTFGRYHGFHTNSYTRLPQLQTSAHEDIV